MSLLITGVLKSILSAVTLDLITSLCFHACSGLKTILDLEDLQLLKPLPIGGLRLTLS